MTYGSLCAGIGGIDLGLDRAGFMCRWQVEIDEYCRKVLSRHWPDVPKFGDIKQLTGSELEPVDLIAGGYPCQPFSQAGKRAGTNDPRHLWPEFARLIRVLRPRYALLENVAGHLSLGFGDVLGDLAGLGYDAEWLCLRASDFGASHIRKRVFIVAYSRCPTDERWCGPGEAPRAIGTPEAEAQQRERCGDSARDGNENLDDAASARLSTGRSIEGRAIWDGARRAESNGRCEPLANPGYPGTDGRNSEPLASSSGSRTRASDHDSGAGGTLENSARDEQQGREGESWGVRRRGVREAGEPVADASYGQLQELRRGSSGRDGTGSAGEILPDSASGGWEMREGEQARPGSESIAERLCFAPGPADPRWPAILREHPNLAPALKSPVRGMADGFPDWVVEAMSDRTKRLSRLGNAVVPQIAEWIARRLIDFGERLESVPLQTDSGVAKMTGKLNV